MARPWPTQPFPTRPPPFDRQGLTEEDLIDFTPELRAEALAVARQYVIGPLFTPPSLVTENKKGTIVVPGTWVSQIDRVRNRQGVTEDDLIDFTPALREAALVASPSPVPLPRSLVVKNGSNRWRFVFSSSRTCSPAGTSCSRSPTTGWSTCRGCRRRQ